MESCILAWFFSPFWSHRKVTWRPNQSTQLKTIADPSSSNPWRWWQNRQETRITFTLVYPPTTLLIFNSSSNSLELRKGTLILGMHQKYCIAWLSVQDTQDFESKARDWLQKPQVKARFCTLSLPVVWHQLFNKLPIITSIHHSFKWGELRGG